MSLGHYTGSRRLSGEEQLRIRLLDALEELEDVAVGGQDQRRILIEHLLVGFHRFDELVELDRFGALVERLGVDLGGLSVGVATNLLDRFIGLGLDLQQIAFSSSDDLGRFTGSFASGSVRRFAAAH